MSGKKEKLKLKLYSKKPGSRNYTRKSISTHIRNHNTALSPRPALQPRRRLDFTSPGLLIPQGGVVVPRSTPRRSSMQASTSGARVDEPDEFKLRSSEMVPATKFLQTGASKIPWPPGQSSADDEEKYNMEQPMPSIKEELQQHWTVTSVSNKRKPAEITPVHSRKIIKRVSSVANNIGQSNFEIKQEHTEQSNSQIMIGHPDYNLLENSENPMLPSDSTSTGSDNKKSEIMHQASNNDNMASFQQVMPETVIVPLKSCVKSDRGDGPSNIMIYEMLLEMQQRQVKLEEQIFDMQQRLVKLEEKILSDIPSVCTVRVDTPANMQNLIGEIKRGEKSVAYKIKF